MSLLTGLRASAPIAAREAASRGTKPHPVRTFVLHLLVAAIVVLGAQPHAGAEEGPTLTAMVDLNRKAIEELKRGKAAKARETLLEAVVLGKQSGLAQHAAMARTYLHLGAVYLSGLSERDKALRHFELALTLRPEIRLTPTLETPALTQAFAEAAAKVSRQRNGAKKERPNEGGGSAKPASAPAAAGRQPSAPPRPGGEPR